MRVASEKENKRAGKNLIKNLQQSWLYYYGQRSNNNDTNNKLSRAFWKGETGEDQSI